MYYLSYRFHAVYNNIFIIFIISLHEIGVTLNLIVFRQEIERNMKHFYRQYRGRPTCYKQRTTFTNKECSTIIS